MVKVIKSSGKEIKVVQEVATQVLNQFKRFINLDLFRQEGLPAHEAMGLERLGGGACGKVYDFGEYIIKVNASNGWAVCKDGDILADLQGLPLVPNLYAYSTDNKYLLIEKVKGKEVGDYLGWGASKLPAPFPKETWKEKLERFYEGAKERGWLPNDCHQGNSMLDDKGNFYIVDFGLFKKADRLDGDDYGDLISQIEELAAKSEREFQKEAV